jgi:hypothetical protein
MAKSNTKAGATVAAGGGTAIAGFDDEGIELTTGSTSNGSQVRGTVLHWRGAVQRLWQQPPIR